MTWSVPVSWSLALQSAASCHAAFSETLLPTSHYHSTGQGLLIHGTPPDPVLTVLCRAHLSPHLHASVREEGDVLCAWVRTHLGHAPTNAMMLDASTAACAISTHAFSSKVLLTR